MIKIATIVGARPQFIKAAVVSRQLRSKNGIEEVLVHTGQHFDSNMSEVFFSEMDIPEPDINLGIHSKSEAEMMGEMVIAMDKQFKKIEPNLVLIYGDTTSTLAGAIAAKKNKLRLAHVEAGMRSFNRTMPEELNRILSDHSSDLLFCSTETAIANLKREGIEGKHIINSGDVMYDAFQFYSKKIHDLTLATNQVTSSGPFILMTLHRQSNVDDIAKLSEVISAVEQLAENIRIVFPCHPRTRKKIESVDDLKNIDLIDPVGYLDMINLLKNCEIVLTDSGGLQKEAYFAKKYCITLRNETEWVELVGGGWNVLAGNRLNELEKIYDDFKSQEWVGEKLLYGNGNASKIIVDEIVNYLNSV